MTADEVDAFEADVASWFDTAPAREAYGKETQAGANGRLIVFVLIGLIQILIAKGIIGPADIDGKPRLKAAWQTLRGLVGLE